MVVRLSDLCAGWPPSTPRNISDTLFCQRLNPPQGHNAAGRTRYIEKSSDLIGNQTRNSLACSIVPQTSTFIFDVCMLLPLHISTFILPSAQQSSFYLFIILYSTLHLSTSVGHLQTLQFLYTIIIHYVKSYSLIIVYGNCST
jgi:hypothetical protein